MVHNPSAAVNDQLVRVRLPSKDFESEIWSADQRAFVKVDSDVFEQSGYKTDHKLVSDYMMFVPVKVLPNQV